MPLIIDGSLIRATPPSRRMSAGTRSSAITAAAPASSATFACSGVTTSMITPPLSISARPLLTLNVASSRTATSLTRAPGPRGRGSAELPPEDRARLPRRRIPRMLGRGEAERAVKGDRPMVAGPCDRLQRRRSVGAGERLELVVKGAREPTPSMILMDAHDVHVADPRGRHEPEQIRDRVAVVVVEHERR